MAVKTAIRSVMRRTGYDVVRHRAGLDLYGEQTLYRAIYSPGSLENRAFYNLGSGKWRHKFWQNVDYASDWYNYDKSLIDIPWDITEGKPLPVESDSAELCYCSHTVEHLLDQHVDHLLREACRILKPGGVLRVTTPNIQLYYEAWKRRDVFVNYHYGCEYPFGGDPTTFTKERMSIWLVNEFASQLVQPVYDGHKPKYQLSEKLLDKMLENGPMEEVFDRLCSEIDFKLQQIVVGHHVNWWTNEKMSAAMKRAGFSRAVVSLAGGSISPAMRDREYFDTIIPTVSLFVDAIK